MWWWRWMVPVVALALASGCGPSRSPRPVTPATVGATQEGVASWYGPGYDGKRTSSGEVFDQDALTGSADRRAGGAESDQAGGDFTANGFLRF